MEPFIFAQQTVDPGGVNIPGWAIGLISLGFVLAILPWGSWVTYTIFSMKSDIVLSNTNDKNIFEKLKSLGETMDSNHKETKKEMKELHGMINKMLMNEFRRRDRERNEEEERDEEKDE